MHGLLDSLRRGNSAKESVVLPYIYVAPFSASAVEAARNPDINTIRLPFFSGIVVRSKEVSARCKD